MLNGLFRSHDTCIVITRPSRRLQSHPGLKSSIYSSAYKPGENSAVVATSCWQYYIIPISVISWSSTYRLIGMMPERTLTVRNTLTNCSPLGVGGSTSNDLYSIHQDIGIQV